MLEFYAVQRFTFPDGKLDNPTVTPLAAVMESNEDVWMDEDININELVPHGDGVIVVDDDDDDDDDVRQHPEAAYAKAVSIKQEVRATKGLKLGSGNHPPILLKWNHQSCPIDASLSVIVLLAQQLRLVNDDDGFGLLQSTLGRAVHSLPTHVETFAEPIDNDFAYDLLLRKQKTLSSSIHDLFIPNYKRVLPSFKDTGYKTSIQAVVFRWLTSTLPDAVNRDIDTPTSPRGRHSKRPTNRQGHFEEFVFRRDDLSQSFFHIAFPFRCTKCAVGYTWLSSHCITNNFVRTVGPSVLQYVQHGLDDFMSQFERRYATYTFAPNETLCPLLCKR